MFRNGNEGVAEHRHRNTPENRSTSWVWLGSKHGKRRKGSTRLGGGCSSAKKIMVAIGETRTAGVFFGGGEHALETLKKQNFIHKNKITKKQKNNKKKEKHC